jgi:hypothetical protein
LTSSLSLTLGTGRLKELVKVAAVGTFGANGTGVDLATVLRFDHVSGIDVSDVGTGISFSPATKFSHVSGEAVQALGSGITFDRPLTRNHAYGVAVVNSLHTAEGYQGPPPNQWFGAPLSARAGSVALMDAGGRVIVDAIVYGSQQSSSSANGSITSPEIAVLEADQGEGGCIVVVPAPANGRGGGPAPTPGVISRSVGRFPDGRDADSLCTDFRIQPMTTLAAPSPLGVNNIKVTSVAGFRTGQTLIVDTGVDVETAIIATVGTAGATTIGVAMAAGETVIPVAVTAGFVIGQTITIDNGATQETAVVSSTAGGGRGGGATMTVAMPLRFPHPVASQVSGSGITLNTSLTRAHAGGAPVGSSPPTPGAANRY